MSWTGGHSAFFAPLAAARLKTVPEVATTNYLQLHTLTPVPYVYHWDANPYI